jgi:hypothetical protein
VRIFIVVLIPKHHEEDQINENNVGGACDTHGKVKCKRFWSESANERDHLEDRGVDGRVGSEWRLAAGCGVDSIGSK